MEACWHNQLMMGGPIEGCTIRELTDLELPDDSRGAAAKRGKAAKGARKVTVPEFTKVVSFASPKMADLDALDVDQYAKPDDTNFRTVDSLALLEKPFCDPSNGNKCVVGFQMTVAPKHPLNNAGGLEIRSKFREPGGFGPGKHVHRLCCACGSGDAVQEAELGQRQESCVNTAERSSPVRACLA
jgi:hypothetical protein